MKLGGTSELITRRALQARDLTPRSREKLRPPHRCGRGEPFCTTALKEVRRLPGGHPG
jgi:hypothetical protein